MNITATIYARTVQALCKTIGSAKYAWPPLVLLTACATEQIPSDPSDPSPVQLAVTDQETPAASAATDPSSVAVPPDSDVSARPIELLDPSTLTSPEEFVQEVIGLMETSPGKCGEAAENTPQVNWTCAEYTNGLRTFVSNWDKLITSAEFSLRHSYVPTSDWMYFAIDGEIDFFWKTYDLDSTQALVAYDPSEVGSELIIGLNPKIGSQIAAANGSHSFTSSSQLLPVQE